MFCVDGFVVVKDVVTDLMKLVSVEVGTQLPQTAIEPVLGIPVFRGRINLRIFWDWVVDFCIPFARVKDGVDG